MKVTEIIEEPENIEDPENTKNIEEPKNYILFIDLDGVLADFNAGVRRLVPDFTEDKFRASSKERSKMWKAVDLYSKDGGKLWGELDPMPDAHQLWNYVKKYNPEILTATGNPKYGAGEQKLEWFPKTFGAGTKVNIVRKSAEKAEFAAPNHILIDDSPKSIDPWVAAGGIGILHTSAANTIAELKKLGL